MLRRGVSNIVTIRMVMPLIEIGRKAGTGFERWQEDKEFVLRHVILR